LSSARTPIFKCPIPEITTIDSYSPGLKLTHEKTWAASYFIDISTARPDRQGWNSESPV
jgi:hypothetical protein